MYNVFSFCGSFLSEMYKYIYIYIICIYIYNLCNFWSLGQAFQLCMCAFISGSYLWNGILTLCWGSSLLARAVERSGKLIWIAWMTRGFVNERDIAEWRFSGFTH